MLSCQARFLMSVFATKTQIDPYECWKSSRSRQTDRPNKSSLRLFSFALTHIEGMESIIARYLSSRLILAENAINQFIGRLEFGTRPRQGRSPTNRFPVG